MNVRAALEKLDLESFGRWSLRVGSAGVVLSLLGLIVNRPQFFRSWLVAWLFVMSAALGGLAVLMLYHRVGGRWGYLIQRICEAAAATMPLVLILFLPILFGLRQLYPWTIAAVVALDEHLRHKIPYLNIPFFLIRAAIYFCVWITLSRTLRRWSLQRDATGEPVIIESARLRRLSTLGLMLYFLTVSFASFDWAMSIEPEWYSTIYGAVFMMGQILEALALAAVMLFCLSGRPAVRAALEPKPLNDLGNMILAFVMLWTYMMFSQYLIIWMGNLTEEIPWILRRTNGGWGWVGLFLAAFHFFLPFFILLFRSAKRLPERLVWIAGWLLFARYVGIIWLVSPAWHPHIYYHWLDVTALAGIGGLWLWWFVRELGSAELLARPVVTLPKRMALGEEVTDGGT